MTDTPVRDTFFHGTDADFDEFALERCGTRSGGASNGALGVWMANAYWLGERFAGDGGTVMEVHCNPVDCYEMSVKELMTLTEDADKQEDPQAYFHDLRARLLANGYGAVAIVEKDGSSDMSILLDTTAITQIKKHDVSVPHAPGPW